MADAEQPKRKVKFPIAGYVLCTVLLIRSFGRFCLKSVINIYLRNKLGFTTDQTVAISHGVNWATDFFTPLGVLIISGITNRYNIVIIAAILSGLARIFIFLGSMPAMRIMLFQYLFWISDATPMVISAGAVNSLGGDQFKVPEENDAIKNFYSVTYVLHNISVLVAYYLGPLIKTSFACFGEQDCYSLSYGISACCTILEIVLLLTTGKFFIKKKPTKGIVYSFSMCIGNGVKGWIKERKTNPLPHWLDYAEPKYGADLVRDIKQFLRVIVILLPFPIFMGVYSEMETKWLFQATRMDGRVGSYTIIPDHYQLLNPLLVLVLVPIINKGVDPLKRRYGMDRVLRRLATGGTLIAVSMVAAGILESKIKRTNPIIPNEDECQIRIFNSLNCSLTIDAPELLDAKVQVYSLGVYTNKHIQVGQGKDVAISGKGSCANLDEATISLDGGSARTLFIQYKDGEAKMIDYQETIGKSEEGFPTISVIGLDDSDQVILRDSKGVNIEMKSTDSNQPRQERVVPESYKLIVKDTVILDNFRMHLGGVYMIMIADGSPYIYEIVEPNSVHILWICIQTTILTIGEVYFAVAILDFLYTESPQSLVQVALAMDIFMEGLGNGFVVILTAFRTMDQEYEYYLSATILGFDVLFLVFLAKRYKPVNPDDKLI